mmetsp:Transcript_20504/g.59453  ORF Transcript_20504/g.59453 Transcript_20504/m.59453 type:complete len:229 (-) Transcript_20504:1622-2308(-)
MLRIPDARPSSPGLRSSLDPRICRPFEAPPSIEPRLLLVVRQTVDGPGRGGDGTRGAHAPPHPSAGFHEGTIPHVRQRRLALPRAELHSSIEGVRQEDRGAEGSGDRRGEECIEEADAEQSPRHTGEARGVQQLGGAALGHDDHTELEPSGRRGGTDGYLLLARLPSVHGFPQWRPERPRRSRRRDRLLDHSADLPHRASHQVEREQADRRGYTVVVPGVHRRIQRRD